MTWKTVATLKNEFQKTLNEQKDRNLEVPARESGDSQAIPNQGSGAAENG